MSPEPNSRTRRADPDGGGSGAQGTDWTRSDPEPVAPGVHRIALPLPTDGLRAVNVYVIEDDDGLVMVDGGWALPESREILLAALVSIGRDVREIRRVLATHIHRDHYTQAVALRTEFGASVALGVGEGPSLEALLKDRPGILERRAQLLRRHGARGLSEGMLLEGRSSRVAPPVFEAPDEWLRSGPVRLSRRTMVAVETPGHTRGHLVFHDPDAGLLFSGDHVLPHITPSIGFEPQRPELPLRDYLASLERVLSLPDAVLLPAHGPAGGTSHARVHALLDHHGRRLSDTHDAVIAGCSTAAEVAAVVRWTGRGRAFSDLESFDQILAVLETAAHLDVLVLQGLLATRVEHVDDPAAPGGSELQRYLTAT